jgi:hypothetical protein
MITTSGVVRDDAHGALERCRQLQVDGVAQDRRERARLPPPAGDGAACLEPPHQPVRRLSRLEPKMGGDLGVGRRGAVFLRNRWFAQIRIKGRKIYLGCFVTHSQAKLAYRQARVRARIAAEIDAATAVPPDRG